MTFGLGLQEQQLDRARHAGHQPFLGAAAEQLMEVAHAQHRAELAHEAVVGRLDLG